MGPIIETGDPQSLNRYSYVLNNPLKYGDPSGHIPCESCVGVGGGSVDAAFAAAASAALAVSQHPGWMLALQRLFGLAPYAPVLPAAADPVNDMTQAIQSLGGNTAGPGGLDPNNWDPSRWGTNYRTNYEQYYGVTRDSNYQVHHVLPQQWREVLAKANINVDDPRWLREVRYTPDNLHQEFFTNRWSEFARSLQGSTPSAQQIIRFAQQLEQDLIGKYGDTLYRQGEGLPGSIDWQALWAEINAVIQQEGLP